MRDETKLSASSQQPTPPATVIPKKSGAAGFGTGGVYTGAIPRFYSVQIDSLDNGQLGTSTYRWSDTGGAVWNASLVPITPNVVFNLNFGIEGIFAPGAGTPDVNLGDRWDFLANVPYHVGFLLDNYPDREYRSNTVTTGQIVTIQYDMTTPQTPPFLVVGHHNFLNTTVVRLQSSESVGFTSLEYNQVVTWTSGHLFHRLISPPSSRYWRLHITCGANQGYLRAAEWYLGFAIGMSLSFSISYREEHVHLSQADLAQLVRGPAPLGLQPKRYQLAYDARQMDGDIANLRLLDQFVNDRQRGLRLPFWLYQDEVVDILDLVHDENGFFFRHSYLAAGGSDQSLVEVVRTAA